MRTFIHSRLALMVIVLGLCSASSLFINAHASEVYGAAPSNIKECLDRLVLAYPNAIDRHDGRRRK
jgi:hypothetical protein